MRRLVRLQEGWSSWFLLFAMLLCLAWSVEAAEWAENLHVLQAVVLPVMIISLVLARSRLPGLVAHPTSGLFAVLWVGYLGTRFFPSTWDWGQRVAELVIHLALWAEAAWRGGTSGDNLVFVLEMALLIWALGHMSIWLVFRRHNALAAMLSVGSVLLVNTYYAGEDVTAFLLVFLVLGFLLIVRTSFFEREQEWQGDRIRYNPDLALYFVRDGAVFALLVVAMAWMVPSVSASPRLTALTAHLARPWHQAQQRWNRLFSSVHYPNRENTASFGTSLAFSGPVHLSDRVVLKVRADGGRYWRGTAYDKYTGAGWVNTDNMLLEVDRSPAPLPSAPYQLRSQVLQSYQLLAPGGRLLFAASQPAQVSLGTDVLLAPILSAPGARGLAITSADISMLYSRDELYRGQMYGVISLISRADEQSLREAGTDYAEWVRERYLQLTPSLPDRVRQRAAEVTAGQPTPYDKAKAVETYLRGFTYNEGIPAPPPGQDGVDYFLFDRQEGYCDYYASSMAVMLRSVGIPARVASGFSQGAYDPEENVFVVREQDAHSWVEVFFPRYGWVEFEPTAAEPVIRRPATPDQGEAGAGEAETPPGEPPNSDWREDRLRDVEALGDGFSLRSLPVNLGAPVVRAGLVLLTLGFLAVAGLVGVRYGRWRKRLGRVPPVVALFQQVVALGSLGGLPFRPWQTAREYAVALAEASRVERAPLQRLADLITRWSYGPRQSEPTGQDAEANLLRSRLLWPLLRFALRPRRPHLSGGVYGRLKNLRRR